MINTIGDLKRAIKDFDNSQPLSALCGATDEEFSVVDTNVTADDKVQLMIEWD